MGTLNGESSALARSALPWHECLLQALVLGVIQRSSCPTTRGICCARDFLVARGMVTKLADFYLGDISPIRTYNSVKRQAMGNVHTKPSWDPLVQCVLTLLKGGVAPKVESSDPVSAAVASAALVRSVESSHVELALMEGLCVPAAQDGGILCSVYARWLAWRN